MSGVTFTLDKYETNRAIRESHLADFENAMNLRQEADYSMNFSEGGAGRVVSDAEEFIRPVSGIILKM